MSTINKRSSIPQAMQVNGVDGGGLMSMLVQQGYDEKLSSAPDGLQVPVRDKGIEFTRGTVVTEDWVHLIELLTGTVGTYVCYERKSGVPDANGYIKHTITNPVIHSTNLRIGQGGYAKSGFNFECLAADETKGIADMHGVEDSQTPPSYLSAARGGYQIISALHGGSLNIYHVTALELTIILILKKASNDGDIGYTCVDAMLDGLAVRGSITFQDSSIASGKLKSQQLLTAAKGNLVLTAKQSQGAANKVLTIAGVDFDGLGNNSSASKIFSDYTVNFEIANDVATPLTLAGINKILTLA